MYLVRKYTNFRRLHLKESSKETAEKELDHLNNKIEKLLAKLEVGTAEDTSDESDECVICLSARAIIEALPCGHKVLCRKCFIKTIQTAIAQRSLPLKCIVCRSKVLKINNPDLDGVGAGGGGGGSQMTSSRPRPKSSSVARCRADYSQTSSAAAAAHTTMTSHPTTTTTKATPVRGDGRTKASHHQSPIVATKLMQPLLIYPSRSSPVQQRAFLTRTAIDTCATPRSLRSSSSSSSSSRHPTATTEATSEAKRTSRFQNLFLRGS